MKRMLFRLPFASALFFGLVFAAGPWVSISSDIAGNDVPMRVSGLEEYETVSCVLVRPDDSRIPFEAQANELGVASTYIHGLHVRQAGDYEVILQRDRTTQVLVENFTLIPAPISAYRSIQIVDNHSVAADGEQVARIRVQAKDAYGNLVTHAPVRAFSSRAEDLVIATPKTNDQGEATIKVSSATSGVSSVSILIGGTLLFERTELIFHLPQTGILGIGASGLGEFLQTQLFDDPDEEAPVAYFSIEDIDSEVVGGTNITVRVGAKDADGNVVQNYRGTVRFSSSDDRAVLPNDYKFVGEDQGWHTFYLSVALQTPGTQTIAVHDLSDFRISGEREVNVSDGGAVVPIPVAGSALTIDVPVNGATFSSSRVTISGTAVEVPLVRLMDGQTELIGALPVDASGKYVYQTPRLADGKHIFQALSSENPAVVSNIVEITIDRSPPEIVSADFLPSDAVDMGAEVILRVKAEEELSEVHCEVNGQAYNLQSEGRSTFSGIVRAPFEPGEYTVMCTMTDLLGNEIVNPNVGTLHVVGFEGVIDLIPEGVVLPLTQSILSVRSQNELSTVDCVFLEQEYTLDSKDSKNFSTMLTAPEGEGTYPVNCTMMDVNENQFTGEKELLVADFITPLDPEGVVLPQTEVAVKGEAKQELSGVTCSYLDTEYVLDSQTPQSFFTTLVAPSQEGRYPVVCTGTTLAGEELRDTRYIIVGPVSFDLNPEGTLPPLTESLISVTSEGAIESANCDFNGQNYVLDMQTPQSFTKTLTTPEQEGIYPVECVASDAERNTTEETKWIIVKAETNLAPLPASNVYTTPGERKVTVFWSPAIDDDGIKQYRVNFGATKDFLPGVNITPDARTQWYVDGLEPCAEMFFQVTPIDTQGVEGSPSEIVPGTPICEEEVHPAPPKTGNASSWWLVVFSIITGVGIVFILRRSA